MKKVVFVSCAHKPLDDRIFHHQAKSLQRNGYEVVIISSKENLVAEIDRIEIDSFDDANLGNKKRNAAIDARLNILLPDIIICDYPIAVIASKKYASSTKTTLIYDVTEWYPSKKNLTNRNIIKKILVLILLPFVNLYAGFLADRFIFGEYYKKLPFILFFRKEKIIIPYYSDIEQIKLYPLNADIDKEFRLFYSGLVNEEKGIYNLINAIQHAARKKSDTLFHLTIIGKFENDSDKDRFNLSLSSIEKNIKISFLPFVSFPEYCYIVGNYDLYFDLRKIDFENNHCLPIKIFIYLACGRPVIYSDLKAIRKDVEDFEYGYLVNPKDSERIAELIVGYLRNKKLYYKHSRLAQDVSKRKYNWRSIEENYIRFIDSSFK